LIYVIALAKSNLVGIEFHCTPLQPHYFSFCCDVPQWVSVYQVFLIVRRRCRP